MLDERMLFQQALAAGTPWQVSRVQFQPAPAAPTVSADPAVSPSVQELAAAWSAGGALHVYLDFPRGSRFACAECGTLCGVYDTEADRVWRHLNFWQHQTLLHARLPRTRCPACGVRTVLVPWARPECGFTLLFEALVLLLARQMPPAALARELQEHDTRLWRIIAHYVEAEQGSADWEGVQQLGFDETALRGREFFTLGVDLERNRVLAAVPGRDSAAIVALQAEFVAHGGQPEAVQTVSIDLSPGYQRGVAAAFPQSRIVFDRFHVMQLVHDVVDAVRRREVREHPELKGTRYLWLHRPEDLTERQGQRLEALLAQPLQTAWAYRWKEEFRKVWEQPDRVAAGRHFQACLEQIGTATPAELLPLAQTLTEHRRGILAYYADAEPVTNAALEGISSLVQAVKARARGYRNPEYFRRMIYLVAGEATPEPSS
jgi:transposase